MRVRESHSVLCQATQNWMLPKRAEASFVPATLGLYHIFLLGYADLDGGRGQEVGEVYSAVTAL